MNTTQKDGFKEAFPIVADALRHYEKSRDMSLSYRTRDKARRNLENVLKVMTSKAKEQFRAAGAGK